MKKVNAILAAGMIVLSACTSAFAKTQRMAEADFSSCFGDLTGCAVFLHDGKYTVYKKNLAQERDSPCSTFKIMATLIGLESGVLSGEDTKMGYTGGDYPFKAWNKDLTLREAFAYSCVWYFRKVIDGAGKETVENSLKKIGYGNCDISAWQGSNPEVPYEINGFWLESSLKISCVEQARILSDIFEGRTEHPESNVTLLKSIMECKSEDGLTLYGKTGTGRKNLGWFTGMYESEDGPVYFSVRVNGTKDPEAKPGSISGKAAKEIALKIIRKNFVRANRKT